ncbi:MAG: crossover junction endodeoxyribonuclease RuvC [Actinomycetota bacterium]|nr:crossover junction endodeoxyribonuclease RuvC [Actinomycetota bacterium]MDQ3679650.1 crossover junction endodeoxyribonuclease RuvC [Actinomycetota bacterium]
MFVLGIDPGLSRCGYGGVRAPRPGGDLTGCRAELAGVLTTSPSAPVHERLACLAADVRSLIAECRPEVVVVERVFFQTNARTAISVAQASGLALAEAAAAGCEVAQYTSNEVKQAVAGYGAATKEQVQRMVMTQLSLAEWPRPPDAADALALALCHLAVAPRRRRWAEARS